MPLPASGLRQPVHDRTTQCQGYRRDDGLWDIEANLLDVKHEDLSVERGEVRSGEPFHVIALRVTLDNELNIIAVAGCVDLGPFLGCNHSSDNLQQLIGLQINNGWARQVRALIGNTLGCAHLTEMLLGPVATTAYQTIKPPYRAEEPYFINSCHMLAEDSAQVLKFWPDHYQTKGQEPS